jgi:hypothetical protein
MLNDLGCELVTAAAARMRSSPFGKRESRTSDHMPGMDGYELARRATVARPGLQVIMVSGPEIDGRGVASRPKAVLQQDLAAAEPRLEGSRPLTV